MQEETRLIFWLDILIVTVVAILVVARQWDWVVALLIGLAVMNYFDHWRSRRR